jgi:hypothetical protein
MNILNLPQDAQALEQKLLATLANGEGSCLSYKDLLSVTLASVYATENDMLIRNFEKYAMDRISPSEVKSAEMGASAVLLAAASKFPQGYFSESRCAESIIDENVSVASNNGLIRGGREGMDVLQLAASCVVNIQNSVEIGARYIFESVINKQSVIAIVNIATLIKAIAEKVDQHECKSYRVLITNDESRLSSSL